MPEDEMQPVIEETDIKLPKVCGGCGTRENVKMFGFTTVAYSPQRQLVPYCQRCTLLIMKSFIQAWQPDVSALNSPTLYTIEKALNQA